MNYRSVADLANCVRLNLYRVPADVDLVVGVPRSGLLAASLIALGRNLKLTDLPAYLADSPLPADNVRTTRSAGLQLPTEARHVLVVDDSVHTGDSLGKVRASVEAQGRVHKITYCAAYVTSRSEALVDIGLERIEYPRAFEWNVMHRKLLEHCCIDIDGVLCPDPTSDQNDDGSHYLRFMAEVPPCILPTYPVGHLVTARLEKYRPQTEEWLSRWGIQYRQLHMLNVPDAVTRRLQGSHATFKAAVYRKAHESVLFVESSLKQAERIVRLSGKPVLCHGTQQMLTPGLSIPRLEAEGRKAVRSAVGRFARILGLGGGG